jgi:hypothetical protein
MRIKEDLFLEFEDAVSQKQMAIFDLMGEFNCKYSKDQ